MPRRSPGARPGPFLLLMACALLAGCGGLTKSLPFTGQDIEVRITPPPGSPAYRNLHLERMGTVVVLAIEGDDVRSNMEKVGEVLLAKGYGVRDRRETLRALREAGLLDRRSDDPEVLRKAAAMFPDKAAVTGSVRVTGVEPLRLLMTLHWVDLKRQKILWTAKASYSGYLLGGENRLDAALLDMIERTFAPMPRPEF